MRSVLSLMFVALSFGFVVTTMGVEGFTNSKAAMSNLGALGQSGAVVVALLAPALIYIGVLMVDRTLRAIGWRGLAAAGVLACAGVGLIIAHRLGVSFGLPV